MKTFALSLSLLLVLSASSSAQIEGNPANWCREGFFSRDSTSFSLSSVKPRSGTRSYFFKDDDDECPAGAGCRTNAYLVRGDTVITNRTFGEISCAWFVSAEGKVTVGWLRTSDLAAGGSTSAPNEKAWTGTWRYGQNTIKISPNKLNGFLNVTGEAFWMGLADNVHIGELDGRFPHKAGVLEYSDGDDEYDCRATLRLVGGRYLVVVDNGYCGGANVRFSGVYTRATPAKPARK